jgi:pentatricopeptide repeat protein
MAPVPREDPQKRTQTWLKARSWRQQDVSMALHLLDEWIPPNAAPPTHRAAKLATKVLRRWLHEERGSDRLIEDALNRVLHVWRKTLTSENDDNRQVSLDLLADFHKAGRNPDAKAYSMVLTILSQRPDLPDTIPVASALLEQCNSYSKPDLVLWNSYLHVLAECSPYDTNAAGQIEDLLKNNHHQITPDARSWAALLRAWTTRRPLQGAAVERAQGILEHILMEKDDLGGANNATVLCNIVLAAWGRLGEGDRAERLLKRILTQEHQPDRLSFLAVLNAWNKSKRPEAPERASQLLDYMEHLALTRVDLRPSVEIYTTVLDTWAQRPDSGPRVQTLLEQLEASTVRPSLRTYAAAIRAWGRSGDPDQAQAIVTKLEQLGEPDLLPDTFTYTALIHAWAGAADAPQQALALLRRMERLRHAGRVNVAPSTVTYNVVLHVLAQHGEADLARALLETMPEPDLISYSTVIHAYTKSNSTEAGEVAMQLLEDMEDQVDSENTSLETTPELYSTVIYAHANCPGEKSAETAESLLWRLQERFQAGKSKTGPTVDVCNAVLRVWVKSREATAPERVEAVVRWMRGQQSDDCLQPNLQTFHARMEVWAYSKRRVSVQRIQKMHDELSAVDDLSPTVASFNHLLTALKYSDMHHDTLPSASAVFNKMLSKDDCRPNRHTFHLMIDMCKFSTRGEDSSAARSLLKAVVVEFCNNTVNMTQPTGRKILDACASLLLRDKDFITFVLDEYCKKNLVVDEQMFENLLKLMPEQEAKELYGKSTSKQNLSSSREEAI